MIAPEYFNNHVAVEGEIIVKSVPNEAGFVLVWNPTTKKISRRTHTEIVSDLNLITSNQLGNYWQKYIVAGYTGIDAPTPFAFLNGGEAQKAYMGGLLVSNAFQDENLIPTNGIYSKGNIATLNYGSASDWNAKVSQSQLNDYVTLNTEQNIEGAKWFKTIGGNQYLNHRLRIISEDNSNPGMVFYKSGVNVGTIQYDGSNYLFTTSDTNAFANLVSAGFIKEGSNNGYALLGGGGHKPLSDFATTVNLNDYIPKTHPSYGITQTNINDWYWYKGFIDNRSIKPIDTEPLHLQFGFTSISNNNTFPYADFLHFGGYQDASGGKQNLIAINKASWGIRQYQGDWQSTDPYTEYVDYWNTGNLPNPVNQSQLGNYVTLNTPQDIVARKTIASSSGNDYLGASLEVQGNGVINTFFPALSFHQPGVFAGVMSYRGEDYGFYFMNSTGVGYKFLNALGYRKEGSDDNYVLTGAGGHKPISDFQSAGQYVRIGGDNTTGNNILLGWTGSQLQATVDATTIGNLWHSGNFNPNTKANGSQNAKAIGFSSGNYPTDDGVEFPYFYFDNSITTGYIPIATQPYVNSRIAANLANYVTVDTYQNISAIKGFAGAEGNGYTGAGIRIDGNGNSNTIYPTLAFHQPTLYAGTISHRGDGFYFMNINGDGFDNVKANGFLKSGSHDGYILLGGGGHKPVSDFATSAQLANYLPLSGGTLTGGGRISEQGVITIQQASTLNATGLFWEKMDDSDFMAGIGALTTGDNFAHVYMGWGLTPWAFANSLAVGENAFRYKDNQVWHAGIFNPDLYLTIRGGQDTALIAKTDFPLSITDYAGDPALTNFQSYYGTSFHFKGGNTWYNRLDFPTTADNLFLYQGINTTDMSLRGYIPIIDINAINWTSLNFSPDSKVSKSGDTMAGALRIGNTNIGKQRVLHLAEPTLLDSYGFDFYTDTNTGLLTLHSLNNGLNNSAPILSANRANNFVGINKENPTTELDVNGNITSNGFTKNNSSDDYFLMGGGGQLTKYSKDDAFVNSYRDFTDGTLITTNIDYSQTQGESFLLEIKGNMYGGGIPMDTKVQGYIYADTIINQSGYSTYSDLTTIIAMNINGNLCFWFPRFSYWQGFSVKAITTGGGGQTTVNRVVSIDNSAEPVGTKQVKIAIYTLATQNWVNNQGFLTSANLNSYVTQSALNAQLGSYATLNGVQTFANTNTFLQSPVIPNGTIGVHAVNLNQLLDVAPPYHWNYVGQPAITNRRVLSEMTWNNYGNGHTIFDISSGTTPWGTSKSNVDAEYQWNPSYPTLVGGNGSGTYGVRVDSARNADNLGGISSGSYATETWVDSNFISKSHPVNNITQANINSWNAAAGGSSHTHSNLSYLNNIDQYLGTGQAPQFSSVRLMNSIGYGTLALEEDYIGGEAGLVDLSNEVFYAGRINEYIKYGSSVNGFEGLNIHFDAKLLGIGREAGNHEDKVQIAGDLSVDTVDIHNTSMQLILNPLYNTDGDVRRSRNAHIYIVTRETVRLPQKPILGQRIEIFNDSDSYIEVTHDNVGTMFKVPGFCKITGIAANKGFKFDTEPIYTKQYDI